MPHQISRVLGTRVDPVRKAPPATALASDSLRQSQEAERQARHRHGASGT